jgi:hypothetical protein
VGKAWGDTKSPIDVTEILSTKDSFLKFEGQREVFYKLIMFTHSIGPKIRPKVQRDPLARIHTYNLAPTVPSFDLSATASQLGSVVLSRRIAKLGKSKVGFPPENISLTANI